MKRDLVLLEGLVIIAPMGAKSSADGCDLG